MRWIYLVAMGLLALASGCRQEARVGGYTGLMEGTTVRVPALTGGQIVRMWAEEGREVAQGDTLAQIDTTEWTLQLQELRASLDELGIQREIAQTAVTRARTDLEYVQQKNERVQTLLMREATPRQNADDLANRLKQARLAVTTAQQQVQTLDARKRQLAARGALLQKKIADATVAAPTDGLVETRYFEPGEAVPPMQPVVELLQMGKLDVKVYIPEEKLPVVRVGQRVTVRVDGLDRAFEGRVSRVSDRAEFTPKTVLTPDTRASLVYAVTVTVPNPDRILKHGMPVEVAF